MLKINESILSWDPIVAVTFLTLYLLLNLDSVVVETESRSLDDLQVTIIPALKQVFGVHDSIASQDISLDGNPAKKITYSYKLFDKMVKNTQVYSFKSGNLYVINYVCDALTCSSYLPVFDKMIHSFRFI